MPLSLALATMPGWWPDGFFVLLQLPGLGWFRAPARYTLLTSLGLALLAGRGLDRYGRVAAVLGRPGRWRSSVGAAAWGWSIHWAGGAEFRAGLGVDTIPARFAAAGLAWGLGLAAIVGWRLSRLGAWAPLSVAAIELGALFFVGPVWWGWEVRLPEASPVLRRLAEPCRMWAWSPAGCSTCRWMRAERRRIPTWASRRRRRTTCSSRRCRRPGKNTEIRAPLAAPLRRHPRRVGGRRRRPGNRGPGRDRRPGPRSGDVERTQPARRPGPWKLVRDPRRVSLGLGRPSRPRGGELGPALLHALARRLPGRGLVPLRGPPALVAGTDRQRGPRPELGRPARPSSSTTAPAS